MATASFQTPSNADAFDPDKTIDTGLDALTRTLGTTQSDPSFTATPGAAAPSIASAAEGADFGALNEDAGSSAASPVAAPTRDSGVGAPGDDNSVRSSINAVFGNTAATALIPQDNALDKFASYTYNISIYLSSPTAYSKLLRSSQKTTNGMQLLMQSGGAPQGSMGTAQKDSNSVDQSVLNTVGEQGINTDQAAPAAASRNQFFPLDFYIDDVKMRSLIMGKGTRGAHNVVELGFRIIEPNGISLFDNLFFACQEQAKSQGASPTQTQNYAAQNYLMVIRFYGYDQDGNLVNTAGEVVNFDQTLGPSAIIEKFIPFQFTGIKFRITNKLTEYECTAVCPQNGIGTGQARGVIPYNVEVTATTLKELLSGNAAYTANIPAPDSSRANNPSAETAPPVASAAPNPTIISGLAAALNKYELERVPGTFTIPDEYEIIIVDDAMQNAKTQPPTTKNRLTSNATVGMVIPADAAQAKLSSKQTVNFNSKNAAILAGTSIVQFIDQAVRNSTYIYDQQLTYPAVDAAGNEVDNDNDNKKKSSAFAWYRIGTQVTPKGYDFKRNDYAYKITYQISMYKVYGVRSDYFPVTKKNGVHKKYKYWFTGQNTQILTFEQDFNYLYYNAVNASKRNPAPHGREQEKNSWQTRSDINDQGQPGKTNEPGANAAAYLYSPADQARVKMSIVGDPAWLQQGELWNGLQGKEIYSKNFLTDGTINFENQEVLFEIEFNTPVDYDMDTGLMDPNRNSRPNSNVYVYKATEVTSNFSRGRFTQDLEGVLITFPAVATKTTNITDLNSESTRRFSNPAPATSDTRSLQTSGTDQLDPNSLGELGINTDLLDPNSLGELGINTDQLPQGGQVDLANTAAAPPPDPPTSGTQQVGVEPNVSFGFTPMAADPEPSQQIARDY
jgi:hypothetical protein